MYKKWFNTFLSHLEVLEEILMLKLIFATMQQNWSKKITHVDNSSFALKTNVASLKTEVD